MLPLVFGLPRSPSESFHLRHCRLEFFYIILKLMTIRTKVAKNHPVIRISLYYQSPVPAVVDVHNELVNVLPVDDVES